MLYAFVIWGRFPSRWRVERCPRLPIGVGLGSTFAGIAAGPLLASILEYSGERDSWPSVGRRGVHETPH